MTKKTKEEKSFKEEIAKALRKENEERKKQFEIDDGEYGQPKRKERKNG